MFGLGIAFLLTFKVFKKETNAFVLGCALNIISKVLLLSFERKPSDNSFLRLRLTAMFAG